MLNLRYSKGNGITDFLIENREEFESKLLEEPNVREKVEEIRVVGNINLLENAHKLILMVVEEKEEEIIQFANQEGIAWANSSLTLSFKLKWVQKIRKNLWTFLYKFDRFTEESYTRETYYDFGKKMNELLDEFLKEFFITYSSYKDRLLDEQKQLVESLSVPIIPISPKISILPLIGTMDSYRANIVEEKVLVEIGAKRVQTLIMDLSGIADMDSEAIHYFLKLYDGISMMGCRSVITGMRPEVVRKIINFDESFAHNVEKRGTVEQALNEHFRAGSDNSRKY
ncbi:STAS domain-containing protein [Virgibacillus sp. YIM 98842]|uniref:STAS domain-containing protein n=1 Tax=Virgibacillus sp. YIM 98842 TaxID=2663533 RepID=UPI0013DC6CD5|nr:STAS domain-containing protein [Virgibacillus sp. YIM 98842]